MNELDPWDSIEELKKNRDYWQKKARELQQEAAYYRDQLSEAHTLLGRVVHQTSERWDSVNLTKHFPTDNLWGKRRVGNPTGEQE